MRVWGAIVLGAGPAGIAAETRLASGGARVVIIDENPSPGGQIWRSVETASAQRLALLGPDYCAGRERVAALRCAPVERRCCLIPRSGGPNRGA